MVTEQLRKYCNDDKSIIALFQPAQTKLNEHMNESQCNNRMCSEHAVKSYCSKECRLAETTENYFRNRRKRL